MKKFTKMMLSAYPRIPHLLKSMDEVIEESAVRSFYDRSASAKQAEKLLYRLNKRDSLAQIYGMMERAIGQLSDSERVVLSDRKIFFFADDLLQKVAQSGKKDGSIFVRK